MPISLARCHEKEVGRQRWWDPRASCNVWFILKAMSDSCTFCPLYRLLYRILVLFLFWENVTGLIDTLDLKGHSMISFTKPEETSLGLCYVRICSVGRRSWVGRWSLSLLLFFCTTWYCQSVCLGFAWRSRGAATACIRAFCRHTTVQNG